MGRHRQDLFDRIARHIEPHPCDDTLDLCWQWIGPTINTQPGTLGRARGAPDGAAALHLRRRFTGAHVEHTATKRLGYRSPQSVSYQGEVVTPFQALFHYLRGRELAAPLHQPCRAERAYAKDGLRARRHGEEPPNHVRLWNGAPARRSMFEGITIHPGRSPRCGARPPARFGGMPCCNPFHAHFVDNRVLLPAPAFEPLQMTPHELAVAMGEWCAQTNGGLAEFELVYDTEDKAPGLYDQAVEILRAHGDLGPRWRRLLGVPPPHPLPDAAPPPAALLDAP